MHDTPFVFAAFIAGVISFLSPCVLPLVPPYLSYISGVSLEALRSESDRNETQKRVITGCIFFILGFSLVFILLGAGATWIGYFLRSERQLFNKIAGIIVILFGLHLVGLLKIGLLYREKRMNVEVKKAGTLSSFLLGVAFAFGWTPCIGPILAGILAYASTQNTVWQGVGLLAVYSLGLGIPFFLSALLMNKFFTVFEGVKRHLHTVEVISGVLLIIIGVLIFTDKFTMLAGYFKFLNRFAL